MNDKSKLKVIIASDVDYENLIAEIYFDNEFVALLQQEDGVHNLKIEFSANIKPISVAWLQYAISEAQKKLVN